MEDRIRMNDLIVLLPGITGSVLRKNGRDLWAPSARAILGAAVTLGGSLESMALDWDDHAVDDLGDQITAAGLIQDAVLIPGLVKVDGYTKISEMIQGCFDVTQGSLDPGSDTDPPSNFFEFPYDWRRDNRFAARRLKELIDLRLPQWRGYAGDKAKVILLAHSMGGIVARHYLEVLGGAEFCKALVTFGTPYRGSLNALDYLANGCRKYFIDMTETMRTFTSVYQLLPIYEAVNIEGGCKKVAELTIEGVSQEKAKEALEFHQTIMRHVDARRGENRDPYVIFPIVGTYQPTLQSAKLAGDKLTVGEALPRGRDELLGHGDGTVPYLSAIPHELSTAYRNTFFAETHGSLQCNEEVLNFIYDQLQDLQIEGLENIRGPRFSSAKRKRASISVRVRDLYAVGEPVVISARILEDGRNLEDMDKYRNHMSALLAEIEHTGKQLPPAVVPFRQKDQEWVLAYEGLPPGLYRVEVRTAKTGPLAPPPVHDLFQVAPAA
jgi:pimeloyl-ACP methyl ester carboxylesterase